MSNEEITFFAIIFGSITTIVFLSIVGSIIKTWIKGKNSTGDITKNKEFLSALRDFKEKTERRISNLEAIASEDHQLESRNRSKESSKKENKNKKEHSRAVEIEMNDESKSEESRSSGNLRNMLNQ